MPLEMGYAESIHETTHNNNFTFTLINIGCFKGQDGVMGAKSPEEGGKVIDHPPPKYLKFFTRKTEMEMTYNLNNFNVLLTKKIWGFIGGFKKHEFLDLLRLDPIYSI